MSTAGSKRTVIPLLDKLEVEYEQHVGILSNLLNISLESISQHGDEIKKYIGSVKGSYREFSDVSHKYAIFLIKSASIDESWKVRQYRKCRENEVNDLIALASHYLKELNETDNSSVSLLSEHSNISKLLRNASSGRAHSVCRDFSEENNYDSYLSATHTIDPITSVISVPSHLENMFTSTYSAPSSLPVLSHPLPSYSAANTAFSSSFRSAPLMSHTVQPPSSSGTRFGFDQTSGVGSSQPVLTNRPQPQVIIPDSASVFIAKQHLFQKAADSFSGEPQRFNSWMNALSNKMAGLNMSA